MASFTSAQVGLSYPKVRELYSKIIPIARTDSSTVKCAIPKGACIVGVHIMQTTDAVTGAGSFTLGSTAGGTDILSAFSMATTKVGLVNPGVSAGSLLFTKLTTDIPIYSTYTVGTSSAGGTGYVVIEYFVPGAQEGVDD